ncbi:P-loop containing nucleoside triphosphate hydrolase protein [Dipodascopsis uninucleata]
MAKGNASEKAGYDSDDKAPLISSHEKLEDSDSFVSKSSVVERTKGYSSVEGLTDEFAGLSEGDADILRQQIDVPKIGSSFFRLYRYADATDKLILTVGIIASILEGLTRPLMAVVFGAATQNFTDLSVMGMNKYYNESAPYKFLNSTLGLSFTSYNGSMYNETSGEWYTDPVYYDNYMEDFLRTISRQALYLTLIGVATSVLTFIKSYIFIDRAEVLSARIKVNYLAATLRQNIGYFDKLGAGEITSRISSDTNLIQEAISEKVSYVISHSSTFLGSVAVSYSQSYILSSIVIGDVFMIIFTSYLGSYFTTKFSEKSQEGFAVGGTLAEETFSSIRNVQAFGIQERMAKAYDKYLDTSEKWGIRTGIASGLQAGFTFLFTFTIDTLCYWQGTRLYTEGNLTVSELMTAIMCLFQGAFAFTIISPYLSNIATGVAASAKIFNTIDRKSAIDSLSSEGETLESVKGEIELRDVRFIYPSRPNVTVLRKFNLKVPVGKTVALVGSSGSGKSTIIGLLERFYNPLSGQILLDGHDIMNFNIRWLRQQIALVSQEPTLFACSIYENICYGLIGTKYEHASDVEKKELVIDACKQANAWDFIKDLPGGLETSVGERGFLMSGGQKQRIAIARAIVSNPKILLLDEATSALDTKSEGVVQEALDRASKNRTTIVIAHRLSTIKDADLIVVMRRGEILEQGTHNELLENKGDYYSLVQAQSIEQLEKTQAADDDIEVNGNAIDEKNAGGIPLSNYITRTKTTETALATDVEEKDEKFLSPFSVASYILSLGRKEFTYNAIAMLSGILTAMAYYALGILYGLALQDFQKYSDPYYYGDELRRAVYPIAGFLFLCGVSLFISGSIGGSLFGYTSSKLSRRIRAMSFRSLLRQDIAYFDSDEHTIGSITSSLASDAQSVETIGGETLNKLVESIVIVYGGLILCIAIGWKLGLVMSVAVPSVMVVGYFRFKYLNRFTEISSKESSKSSNYACEAASAIRTVLTLTREEEILEHYRHSLNEKIVTDRVASIYSAIFDSLSRGLQFFIMALGFYYGGILVSSGEYSLFQFFVIFIIIVFGSESSTTVFTFAPEMSKAVTAGRNIEKLLESRPVIDAWSTEGAHITNDIKGEIEFKNIHFRYPTRPEVAVLRGLNLSIKQGQFVALVGSSGCGKSTTIGLIESFYRPQKGTICLDGVDISHLNIASYRSAIALVQQEPMLYAGSIKYNISLGTSSDVTDEEIYEVCRQANIHDFIMSLPEGYDTLCGSKGALLSGGQKQRIAIARALIRKPKILLLDEATSALDSESEKVVQAALDKAAKGRTTIAIAHRLSTVQGADVIYVLDEGRVLESGTHQQLLAQKGRYYDLVKLQALEEN